MINALGLIGIVLGVAAQNVVKKPYTLRHGEKGVYLLNAIVSFTAMLFFVLTASDFKFSTDYLIYAAGFGISFAVASIFIVLSIANGPLSLVSLFISYSLMLPTFYGLIFLHDPIGVGLIPGLVLLVISLYLTNKTEGKGEKITFKWLIYVIIALVGNGMCSVIQKMQQVANDGAYKNEFMATALLFVTVIMIAFSIATERKKFKNYISTGWYIGIIAGIANAVTNLLVMIFSARMPVSILFPLVSAGGIIVTFLVSVFLYKEKLSKMQIIGIAVGTVSVVCLNL